MNHVKLNTITLKNHPKLTERWLQDVIADDPSLLGIGDVELKDRERSHRGAGRLDLLLQEADGYGRYEVELQLGATDESHIIRTLEYWDIERKKYPQYDHTAVIIAEDVTSRFLNVISLFNGFIPIIAIQVTAIETAEGIGLQFTRILDTVKLGFVDEDEVTAIATDRSYWENNRATKKTVSLADDVLAMAQTFLPKLELSYNKYYMGFWLEGRAFNFAVCRPQKSALRLDINIPQTEAAEEIIHSAGIDFNEYDKRGQRYKLLKLTHKDIESKKQALTELLQMAYEARK